MTQISTFLMFSGDKHGMAEAAVNFYVSQFADARVHSMNKNGPGAPEPGGTVWLAAFTLNGQRFIARDSAAPHTFNFTPSLSMFVTCETDEEISRLFAAFSPGGQTLMPLDNYGFSKRFGWVQDRFGVSWQFNLPA